MTIWEKAILNIQKGTQKITNAAVFFSERVKAEIGIIRLRIKLDEVQDSINEQCRTIGSRVAMLARNAALPKTAEQLLQDEEIAAAMTELEARTRDLEDLRAEIANEQSVFARAAKDEETKK